MAWRKWLVRGLAYSALGAMLLVGLAYRAWTSPAATRRQVLDKLGERFVGAVVAAEAAHLRLLGGIAVSELRMARRDDLDRNDFLYVPAGVIYHDKEELWNGRLAIKRIELNRPRIRVVRERDGRWNLEGILSPPDLHERVPLIVLKQATIQVEDRAAAPGAPLLELTDVSLTVVNDPLPVLVLEGSGQMDVAGPVQFSARVYRADGATTATVEAPAVPVGAALVQRLAAVAPEAAAHLRQLTGHGSLQAGVAFTPGATPPLSYDATAELHRGSFTHPRLPLPLEQVEASAHVVNGKAAEARLTARSGDARLAVTLKDVVLPAGPVAGVEDFVGELDATVERLPVWAGLFTNLPDDLKEIHDDYKPEGPVTITHALRRDGSGWRKRWVIRPEGMSGEFFKFPYPLQKVTGVIERTATSDRRHTITLNLQGLAGGKPMRCMGRIAGEKSREEVEVDLWASDVELDETLRRALPVRTRAIADQFRPTGRADVKAFIRRAAGSRAFANRYHIRFHDTSVRYALFPYPLENVAGTLDVHPDHWECHDFRGTHKGGEFVVNGRSFPGADPHDDRPQRVRVAIQGTDILLDEEFEAALAPPEVPSRAPLQRAWRTLALGGRLSFAAEVEDVPGQPQDIDVAVAIRDCTMRPRFFPYALDGVCGGVRYTRDKVHITEVRARHGPSRLGLKAGTVDLKPGGGFYADFGDVTGDPLLPDAAFLDALPDRLRKGLQPFKLRDPVNVRVTRLVVDAGPDGGPPPAVYWDGVVALAGATVRTGVELHGVNGRLASRGLHNGRELKELVGNVQLNRVAVLGQPLANVSGSFHVRPDSPDVLRVRDLKGDLFGGTVGGEARVEFDGGLHYDVALQAVGVRLEEFARHNLGGAADVQGAAQAALHLWGDGTHPGALRGDGRVEVPSGKLYRLPLLLDLLKWVGLRVPDRTAFEQATLDFHIDGSQVQVRQLDLYGNVVSLRGQGTVNLDGSDLNLDFHADPARVMQVLPAGWYDLPRALGDRLFKVKMRGSLGKGGKVEFERELVPGLTAPLRRALGER